MEKIISPEIESGAHFNDVNTAIKYALADAERDGVNPIFILDFDGTAYPTLLGAVTRKISSILHQKNNNFEIDINPDLLERIQYNSIFVTNRSPKSFLNPFLRNSHTISKAKEILSNISIYSGLDRQAGKRSFLRDEASWSDFLNELTSKVDLNSKVYVISDRGSLTMAIDFLNIGLSFVGKDFLSDLNFCRYLQNNIPNLKLEHVSVNHLLFRLLSKSMNKSSQEDKEGISDEFLPSEG